MAGTNRPEIEMVRRAIPLGVAAVPVAFAAGALLDGVDAGVSAAIGVVVVLANFAAHGWSLAWASTISIALVQGVALAGFVVRLGVIVALMFLLNATDWFSPLAFGLAVVPGTLLLLVYETRLALRGLGARLQIPADDAAAHAAERLAAREP
jgi:hypothetical protein